MRDSWITEASEASEAIIILKSELPVSSVRMWISEREGDTSTGCGTYPLELFCFVIHEN